MAGQRHNRHMKNRKTFKCYALTAVVALSFSPKNDFILISDRLYAALVQSRSSVRSSFAFALHYTSRGPLATGTGD